MFYGANQQAPMMNWYNQQNTNANNYQNQQMMQPQFQSNFARPMLSSIPGKVVTRPEEITPSDVPMDGSMSLFPLADGSSIIGRTWNNDGTIRTIKYVIQNDIPVAEESKPDANIAEILNRLDTIEKLLNRKPEYESKRKGGDDHANS